MRIPLYVTFSLEYMALMEVRNFTEGPSIYLIQFQGLSPSARLPARSPASSSVVSDAMYLGELQCESILHSHLPIDVTKAIPSRYLVLVLVLVLQEEREINCTSSQRKLLWKVSKTVVPLQGW